MHYLESQPSNPHVFQRGLDIISLLGGGVIEIISKR